MLLVAHWRQSWCVDLMKLFQQMLVGPAPLVCWHNGRYRHPELTLDGVNRTRLRSKVHQRPSSVMLQPRVGPTGLQLVERYGWWWLFMDFRGKRPLSRWEACPVASTAAWTGSRGDRDFRVIEGVLNELAVLKGAGSMALEASRPSGGISSPPPPSSSGQSTFIVGANSMAGSAGLHC